MPAFLVIVVVLVTVNVWAIRRVLAAPDGWGVPKRLLIMGIWIMPFMGALIARAQTPAAASNTATASVGTTVGQPEAPDRLQAGGVTEFNVSEHLDYVNGVPVPDWGALTEWAQRSDTPEAAAAAIDQGRRAWLLHLRNVLGPGSHLHTSDDTYIVSTLEPKVVEATAQYVSKARRRIARVLGPSLTSTRRTSCTACT